MSTTSLDVLFRPFRIGSLEVANRVVMAPMTRSFAAEGIPSSLQAAYYRRRAEGGVGLILSEGTVVDRPASRNEAGVPFFHGEQALAGWKSVIDTVHAAGGKMGPQLWHTGAVTGDDPAWNLQREAESPSGLEAPGKRHGIAMSDEAIADTISAFARAARNARALGFDIVELHAAHGYLIDEFFWSATNLRTDRYGGATLTERSRFAVELVSAVREAVGPDFPISMRVSQWKQQNFNVRLAKTPEEMRAWLQPLVSAGVSLLHCSQRRFWEPEFPEIDGPEGLNFAGWVKKLTGAATISVGSAGLSKDFISDGEKAASANLEKLVTRMEREEFDLIAVGRALISDPQWLTKVRHGEEQRMVGFNAADLANLV